MATLNNQKIRDTFAGLIKTENNAEVSGQTVLTDGLGNSLQITVDLNGNVTAQTVTAGNLNVSDWDNAYAWGDHSLAGYATSSEIATAINDVIDAAPEALNTLDELAAALNDDANFATTVTNSISSVSSRVTTLETNNTGVNTGDQDISGITTNANAITTLQGEVDLNTAKVGITTAQADAIVANTAKNSYPAADSTKLAGIEAGAEVNPTSTDELSEGTTNLYYTEARVSANTDVAANTAKVGITAQQASDITANNAKISFDSASSTKLAGIEAGAEVNDVNSVNGQTGVVSLDTVDLTDVSATAPTDGQVLQYSTTTSKYEPITLSSTAPVDSVNTQTGAVVLDTDDISEGLSNLYYTEARVSANTDVAANTAKNSYPSADATKLAGIEAGAEVNPTSTDALSEGTTNLYYTEARVSANTDVAANTAKVGITTAQSDAIVANTAKNSYPSADATKLAGIEAGAEVNPTSTDGLSEGTTNLYYTDARVSANSDVVANTAKNSYPSADATKVGHITVTQAVDLDTMESDVTTNNAKNSYPSADATKVGHITVTQAVDLDTMESDVATNNAKVGITTAQADAIVANTAKNSYPSADATKLAGIEAGAEVNPTASEIKTDYESNLDTNAFTDAEKTKLSGIEAGAEVNDVTSVNTQTGAVVLDADDISDATTTNKWATATEKTKLGHISVTQAVDLDTMESDIATNNAKNSYPSADATKVGHISVTQAVDLDTMESDIATNNAKVSNVSTDLSTTTSASSVTILSSDGQNAAISGASGTVAGVMTASDKNKLDGIASGAEVNVNADWNAISGDAQILNKPTIPTATSDLTNDSGFMTPSSVATLTNKGGSNNQWTNDAGYITGNETITLSGDISGSGTTAITASIASNVVGADELNVTGNGTSGQVLSSDGDGTFSWVDGGGASVTSGTVSFAGFNFIVNSPNNSVAASGTYYQVGNLMTVFFSVDITGSSGAEPRLYRFTALPDTVKNNTSQENVPADIYVDYSSTTGITTREVWGRAEKNTTTIRFGSVDSSGNELSYIGDNGNTNTTITVNFKVTYEV